jgi:hypothetical protein
MAWAPYLIQVAVWALPQFIAAIQQLLPQIQALASGGMAVLVNLFVWFVNNLQYAVNLVTALFGVSWALINMMLTNWPTVSQLMTNSLGLLVAWLNYVQQSIANLQNSVIAPLLAYLKENWVVVWTQVRDAVANVVGILADLVGAGPAIARWAGSLVIALGGVMLVVTAQTLAVGQLLNIFMMIGKFIDDVATVGWAAAVKNISGEFKQMGLEWKAWAAQIKLVYEMVKLIGGAGQAAPKAADWLRKQADDLQKTPIPPPPAGGQSLSPPGPGPDGRQSFNPEPLNPDQTQIAFSPQGNNQIAEHHVKVYANDKQFVELVFDGKMKDQVRYRNIGGPAMEIG